MIINDVKERTKSIQDLSKRKSILDERRKNQDLIKQYNILIQSVAAQTECIRYAEKNFSFSLPDELRGQIRDLLTNLKSTRDLNRYSREAYQRENAYWKKIQTELGKQWTAQYEEITADTVQTLENIRGIGGDGIGSCLQRIRNAKDWPPGKAVLEKMDSALKESANLVRDLNLSPELNEFLFRMKNGQARLTDLTESVLAWIWKEHLETRIKLSFAVG